MGIEQIQTLLHDCSLGSLLPKLPESFKLASRGGKRVSGLGFPGFLECLLWIVSPDERALEELIRMLLLGDSFTRYVRRLGVVVLSQV